MIKGPCTGSAKDAAAATLVQPRKFSFPSVMTVQVAMGIERPLCRAFPTARENRPFCRPVEGPRLNTRRSHRASCISIIWATMPKLSTMTLHRRLSKDSRLDPNYGGVDNDCRCRVGAHSTNVMKVASIGFAPPTVCTPNCTPNGTPNGIRTRAATLKGWMTSKDEVGRDAGQTYILRI